MGGRRTVRRPPGAKRTGLFRGRGRRRPGIGWSGAAVATSLALLSVAAPSSLAAQLQPPEVTDVRFRGNETFPDDSLARAIVTRETECRSRLFVFFPPLCPLGVGFALDRSLLRERELPRDRARLTLWYRQRGFQDVQVDTPTVLRDDGTAEVVFPLNEGRPYIADSVAFTGAVPEDLQDILEDLPFGRGDRLSSIALDATRDSITNRLADRGYAYAEVYRSAIRPADDPYNAVVTFDIVPGPRSTYGDITVAGLRNLSVGTVLRTVQISTGELYRKSEIEEATARLYGLQIVRSATVTPDTASIEQDPVIDVAIRVQEGDAYRVRAGGGWDTAECFNVEARWTSRDFLGGGRLLQIRGRVGNLLASDFRDVLCAQSGRGDYAHLTGLASVEFVQPWIFSTRNSFSASVFAERQAVPDIFIRRAVGAQIALSRSISPQTVLTAFYRPELSELEADSVLFCTGFLVCDPSDVAELAGANFLAPFGLSLARDRSDDLLNPRRGYRWVLDVEHAAPWTLSQFRYDRIVAEGARYEPVGSVVLAGRIRGGWVGSGVFENLGEDERTVDIVHPQKRFYTGGANSVRGFAQSGLGPRVLFASPARLIRTDEGGGSCAPEAVADLSCMPAEGTRMDPRPTGGTRVFEANAEVRFPVGSVLEGVLFGDVGQAWGRDQSIDARDLEFTPGVGVRIPSPVGPIRVDLAYRFRGAERLTVVTEEIRPRGPDDAEEDLIVIGEDEAGAEIRVPWVSTGNLVRLGFPFLFGVNDQGLQLHVSIGQAF